ncbi:hypothetical protein NADFUDRAFT_58287 [Nadsonia fulvescens var. elongata DSM 6958]|uniref:Uncharacterized protein n=1 Tax=Nadsonia fulvescens var. elongata DSM 6958 TaxID=857566 RepID=A0A1E3PKN1_9ASCO|nr:hypothetical protein NADFUDRAFT_58287 [Nadsonia fulvescens var. elongata DSM 6958]
MFNLRSNLVAFIGLWALLVSVVNCLNIPVSTLAVATTTNASTRQAPTPTAAPALVDLEIRKNKFIDKRTSSTSTTPLAKWVRTVNGNKEVVTPSVIGGITFGAKPTSVNGPLPWISLEKNGSPKTIQPKIKDGLTKNASPDYGDYFKTPHTVTHKITGTNSKSIGEEIVDIEYTDEDLTYQMLNPIIRCTPDRYFERKKDGLSSEPFCTPQDNQFAIFGKTHWVSWYTKFFPDEPIRVLLSYVNKKQKYGKRDIENAFFKSEYTNNIYGLYPLEVQEEWLKGDHEKDIVLSLQYKSLADEDVNLLNGTLITIKASGPVMKDTKKEKQRLGIEDADDEFLYAIIIIPALLLLFFLAYAFVIFLGRGRRSWAIPKIKRRRRNDRDGYYDRLPEVNSYEHPFELKAIHRKDQFD